MNEQLERLLKNYSNARLSWEAWCFMINYNVNTVRFELARHIKNDNFLSHYRYLAMKDYYIEMYKVVKQSKNSKDNIYTLLQAEIDNNTKRSSEAQKCLNQLVKIEPTIKTICDLRDKFYAHLDKDYQDYIYKGISINDDITVFSTIENSIITLTSLETLQTYLDKIPSRNDFKFELSNT